MRTASGQQLCRLRVAADRVLANAGSIPKLRMLCVARHVQLCGADKAGAIVTPEDTLRFKAMWQRHDAQPMAARNALVEKICPDICDLFDVKFAVMLVLMGGVEIETEGKSMRGKPHLLLAGDPGTGKSRVMQFAASLVPRCAA
jgi:DNA replicative helicase MCM subunit Mcm2 (Cdc46/Mcm family)